MDRAEQIKREVITNIMGQIDWRQLKLAGFKFIDMGNNTLKLHKGKKNLDIKYDDRLDLYDISRHIINKDMTVTSETVEGVYYDNLHEIIERFFKFEYVRLVRV